MRVRTSGHWVVSFLLLACSSACSEPGQGTTGSATAAASGAKPAGGASGAAAASSSAGGPAAATGKFALVAESARMVIHPLGSAAVLDADAFYALLGPGPLEQDPLLVKTSVTSDGGGVTVTPAVRFAAFHGAWPAQVAAIGNSHPGVYARVNDTWADQNPLRDGETLRDLTAWGDGRAIAAIKMAEPDIRFVLFASKPGGVVPGPGKPTPEQTDCTVRMDPASALKLAGTQTEHLFAIGKECKTGKPITERWNPKEVRGTAEVVAGVPDGAEPADVLALAADEAYAAFNDASGGFLATWDGKAWKAEPAPCGKVASLFASPDGASWCVGDRGLFSHKKGAAWTKLDVPAGKPTSAWAKDADNVWVVLDDTKLYRSGEKVAAPLELAKRTDVESALQKDRRWLATAACKRIFVHLAAIGPSGGQPPKSFAGVDDVIAGNAKFHDNVEYVVEEIGPTQTVGAKVPSMEVAKEMAAAFKAKNASAPVAIYCHEPIVKAKLLVK